MNNKNLENRTEGNRKNIKDSVDIVKISLEDNSMRKTIADAYIELLETYKYNISAIIRYLEIPRQTFYNKLRQYNIDLQRIRKIK